MKPFVFLAALAAAVAAVAQEPTDPASRPASAAEKLPVRVLYVGDPSQARTQEFVALLSASFTSVVAAPRRTLEAAAESAFDVVIVDAPRGHEPPAVAPEWRRPTILVGSAGGRVAAARKLKLTPIEEALGGAAYAVRAEHPVFRDPVSVDFGTAETVEPTATWRASPGGAAAVSIWRVHAESAGLPTGVAADAYGFEDSPDCELFAGGFSPDHPGLAAIARQGPFLLWGFAAPPADWTPSARRAFVAAIAYLKRFDGAPILVTDPMPARDRALAWARQTGADPALASRFDSRLRQAAAGDAEKLYRELEEGRAWLRADRRTVKIGEGAAARDVVLPVFSLDEEIRNYGIRCDETQLVDTMLNIIGHGEDVEKCHRLLVTYVGVDLGPDLRHWFSWWSRNKDRAFFSETAGYRFVVPEPAVSAEIHRLAKFSRPAEK
jgi:hypothetical protein